MGGKLKKAVIIISVLLLTILAIQPIAMALTPASYTVNAESYAVQQAIIDPRLLDENTYSVAAVLNVRNIGFDLSKVASYLATVKDLTPVRQNQALVYIITTLEPWELADKTHGVVFGFNTGKFWLVKAWVTIDDVNKLSTTNGVYAISLVTPPYENIQFVTSINKVHKDTGDIQPTLYKAVDVIGASKVWEEFNITGQGIVVGVVDSGVDFGTVDLGPEVIYRVDGIPLILDSDEIGLTLTLSEAIDTGDGYVNVTTPVIYFDGFFWTAGQSETAWLLYTPDFENIAYYEFEISRYHIGDIQSGAPIKFGLSVQTMLLSYGSLGLIQFAIPVIVVDKNLDGAYDTVYADTSTMYYLFMRALYDLGIIDTLPDSGLFDLSFADEEPVYYGNEVVARDFTGDGENDFSAGTLAGYVYDYLGVLTGLDMASLGWPGAYDLAGLILPGFDTEGGNYVTFGYDWIGHGTSVASVIGGRGVVTLDLGYGQFNLKGIAPSVKLAANTGLINPFVSQLFFAGLDQTGYPWNWTYTGNHKVDIISNSWGLSYIGLVGFMSTFDPFSLIEDYIVTATGTIVVHAMGNGGPGYGTATIPGSSSQVISVGASTLFDYRVLYDYLPGAWGEVVSWSDRGPTNAGLAKPDVVNIGSFAWARAQILAGLGDGAYAYDLFGGTSEATPMTSGSVALILEAYVKTYGVKPSPGLVKSILKSTAKDLGYEPYVQGSGHVDAYEAVKSIIEGNLPIAYTFDTYNELSTFYAMTSKYLPSEKGMEPQMDTMVYTGVMAPGDTKTFTIKMKTFRGTSQVELSAVTYIEQVESLVQYLDLNRAIIYTPDGIMPLSEYLADVQGDTIAVTLPYTSARILIPISEEAFTDVYNAEIVARYPYQLMDPFGRQGSYVPLLLTGVELHYGFDLNNDGVITTNETSRINYDIRLSNVFHVNVGYPEEKFKLAESVVSEKLGVDLTNVTKAPVLDIRIIRNLYPLLGVDVTLPITLELRKTIEVPCTAITLSTTSLNVTSNETEFSITVTVPDFLKPGLYQAYIKADYGTGTILIPVSIAVAATVKQGDSSIILSSNDLPFKYKNYKVEGKNDWTWRYESGDWRSIPLIIEDPTVVGFGLIARWENPSTSIDMFVAGPGPTILAGEPLDVFYGSVVAGKFSLYIGGSGYIVYYDVPAPKHAALMVPVTQFTTGIPYWIVLHNTILGGEVYPEEFTLIIKPIRAVYPQQVTVQANQTTDIEIQVSGSYMLSLSNVIPIVAYGNATATVTPQILGAGLSHSITLSIQAETDSIVVVALLNRYAPTYAIGLTVQGQTIEVLRQPGIIVIPIAIAVQ